MSNDRERRSMADLTREQIDAIRLRADSGFLVDDDEWNALCDMALAYLDQQDHNIPLCGDHAQTWFTERNFLEGGMAATCVVCAHASPPADRKAVIELIERADAMLAPLGYHGTINARDDRVSAFSDALERVRALTQETKE